MTDGRILGHEAVGTVVVVGAAVKNVQARRPGSRVVHHRVRRVPFLPRGPLRAMPRRGRMDPRPPHRRHAGGVRPGPVRGHVDLPVPAGVSDENVLMVADILPTGYEVGVLNGQVRPGDVVAIVGAGPIGLSAIMGARLFSPSHIVAIDLADSRLDAAKQFGADVDVNNGREDPLEVVRAAHGRARRRRRHRSGRHGGHVRAGHDLDPPVRPRREHRSARKAGDTAPRRALDHGRHDHHGPGRHVLDTDVVAPRYRWSARRRALRHAPLRAGRHSIDAYDTFARAADTGALKVVITPRAPATA